MGNICLVYDTGENISNVFLYTQDDGRVLLKLVRAALIMHDESLDDPPVLARNLLMWCNCYGIDVVPSRDDDDDIVYINIYNQWLQIGGQGNWWTFEEFINGEAGHAWNESLDLLQ